MEKSNTRKKVFFILPSLAGGGAERVFMNLTKVFVEKYHDDFEVTLIVFSQAGTYKSLVPKNVHIVDLGIQKARYVLIPLWRFLRKERPQVVISTLHAISLVGLVLLLIPSRPLHIARLANPYSYDSARLGFVGRILYRFALAMSDVIIALTERMKEDIVFALGLKDEKVRVISNPFDIEQIKSRSAEPLHEQIDHPAILMCGRLAEQKDYPTALLSCKLLLQKIPSVKLYILGEGPLEEHLMSMVHELDISHAVQFLGFQSNPYQFIAAADVFLLTSIYEGFPNVILEALAVGTPVVSTDCFTGPEEILQQGVYGDLVPVGDSEAVAIKLEENICRLSEQKIQRKIAGERRANDFNKNIIAAQYAELVNDL